MEWHGDLTLPATGPDPGPDPGADPRGAPDPVPNNLHTLLHRLQAQESAERLASLCQSQQRCVQASVVCGWGLAEAQDRLCGLELHGSESTEQRRAQDGVSSAELRHTEQEWQRKESLLGEHSPRAEASWDGFDKSIINVQSKNVEMDQDSNKTFVQMYEKELRHFGMLRRWDDSQRFLADLPQLICEETANHLILWCFKLQADEKEALMEQVAHQAVVMQFILEMASSSQQDPKGCFRQFFHKARAGQEGYLDVFHTELGAFKRRVKEYTLRTKVAETPGETPPRDQPQTPACCRLDPKEVLESLPPELKAGFQLQDMQILQNVLSTMNPQVAEYHVKRCVEAGLWVSAGRWAKDDATEADDLRMMETS